MHSLSWSEKPYHPTSLKYKNSAVCLEPDGELHSNLVCPVTVEEQPEKTLPDLQSLEQAIKILKKPDKTVPLFLAVGFYKPHISFKCPKEYLELYPINSISPVKQPQRPYDLPLPAWQPWTDVRERDDISALKIPFPFGLMPELWARKIKQNYYSCVSYIDNLIGQLLSYVDMENTIVVLVSDHGWSLGENGMWAKYSTSDAVTRVPLIIYAPGLQHREVTQPVELVDLFPTIVQLADLGIDVPKCSQPRQTLCHEGKSLIPLMHGEDSQTNHIALSQYPRPSAYPQWNTDQPKLKSINIMGYSLRTDRYRYTEWVQFDHLNFKAHWNVSYGVELYDHEIDENESINLYKRPGMQSIVQHFSSVLRESFKSSI